MTSDVALGILRNMNTTEKNGNERRDFVAELMEITARGLHARIIYRKGGKEGESERVIEPRKLVDGPNGLMVRAVQVMPEAGIRTFSVHKIVEVAEYSLPLDKRQRAGNNFCTGEVVEFSMKSAYVQPPAGANSVFQTAWSQEWFHRYVGVVRQVLSDAQLTQDELALVSATQSTLVLSPEQVRAAHAYIIGEELLAMSVDGQLMQYEQERLRQVARILRDLGWSPL